MAIPFTLETLGNQAQQHALTVPPQGERGLQPLAPGAGPGMALGMPSAPSAMAFDPRSIPAPTFSGERNLEAVISITDLIRYVRKRGWLGFLLGLPLAILTFIVLGTGPKVYEADSQILLRLQDANVFNFDELAGSRVTEFSAPMLVNNHRTELKSRRFIEYLFHRFPEDKRTVYIDRIATGMGRKDQLLSMVGLYKPGVRGEDLEIFADAIQSAVEVDPLKDSHILRIQVRDSDPDMAAFIANRYVEDYIHYVTVQEMDLTKSVSDYLGEKSEELKRRLRESEEDLAKYRKSEGLMEESAVKDVAGERVKLLGMAITEANMKLSQAKSDLAGLEQSRDSGRDMIDLRIVAENKDVAFARAQLDQKIAERAPLESMLGRRHPTMVALNNEIEQLRSSLDAATNSVVKMAESEVRNQERQLEDYQRQLEEARTLTLDQTDKSIQQNLLKDQVEMDRQLYQKIEMRRSQASLTEQFSDNGTLRISDLATPPDKPVKPNKPIAAIASAMLFGLVFFMVPIGWGLFDDHMMKLFKAAMKDRPATTDAAPQPSGGYHSAPQPTVTQQALPQAAAPPAPRPQLAAPAATQAPVLARLPYVAGGTAEATLAQLLQPEPAGAQAALRQLTGTLERQAVSRGGGRVILLTSAEPGEGKTLAAAALAAALCHQGRSVFMMECNPSSPTLHQWFPHSQPHSSWAHDLEALRYGQTNLFLLPGHDLPAYATSELLDGYRAWIDRARHQVDWIILDAAPMLRSFADVAPLAPMATDVLIVNNPNVTTPAKLKAALSLLQPMMSTNALRGLILNGASA